MDGWYPNGFPLLTLSALWVVWMTFVCCLLARKSGYRTWHGLLLVVPPVNLIFGLLWVFDRWPIQRQLEQSRKQLKRYEERYGPLD